MDNRVTRQSEAFMEEIQRAQEGGRRVLSELESRDLLAGYGLPLVAGQAVKTSAEAVQAAEQLGYPVVLKGVGADLAHKTEAGVVRLDLRNQTEVENACAEIVAKAGSRLQSVLVQRMLSTDREFVAGLKRDPQFGPCVMFGLGGIFAEVFKDVTFRVAPLSESDARQMLTDIRLAALLGEVRGLPAVDRGALVSMLVALGRIGLEREDVIEIDINPILFDGPCPLAADALVVLDGGAVETT